MAAAAGLAGGSSVIGARPPPDAAFLAGRRRSVGAIVLLGREKAGSAALSGHLNTSDGDDQPIASSGDAVIANVGIMGVVRSQLLMHCLWNWLIHCLWNWLLGY